MDKSDFTHFVKSIRWHCTISMKNTRLNEDIDRAVLRVCDVEKAKSNSKFCCNIGVGRLPVITN